MSTTDQSATTSNVLATVTGPVVMIGFGSIGRGVLPAASTATSSSTTAGAVVIEPDDRERSIVDGYGLTLRAGLITVDNYRDLLTAAAHRGRRAGVLHQPVGRHVVARHAAVVP